VFTGGAGLGSVSAFFFFRRFRFGLSSAWSAGASTFFSAALFFGTRPSFSSQA
jgi:hypothetical protein